MSDKPIKKKASTTANKIDADMSIPPGEHLVPLKAGLNTDETWVKNLTKKTR